MIPVLTTVLKKERKERIVAVQVRSDSKNCDNFENFFFRKI